MTGRYDDSAQRPPVAWQPPASGENPPVDNSADNTANAAADQPELYVEPSTDSQPHPAAPEPGGSGQHRVPSGPYQVPGGSGPYQVPGGSGPYQVPGGSGPHQVQGGSGPYQVPGGSGAHQVPSGPYQVPGGSGPYQVPGGSGPYQVQGGSGPYPVPPQQPPLPPGYQYAPQPQQHQQPQQQPFPPQPQQLQHDLSSSRLIKQDKKKPQSGWRKAVYVATGHLVNMGESNDDARRRELILRVNQPLRGCYKIAMLSLKGGVGKTTVTTTLGSTFSSLRGDRVIAVDANPDRGTLSQKIPLETTATVRHLLRDASRVTKYSDVRAYTSQGPSRLEVLASEQDPAVSEAFSEDDYRRTVALLEHFYNIVLTDCGTGLMHSAMKGVLDIADSLVIVSSGSVDGARSASATLDWLDAHGYRDLVARSVAVINSVRPKSGSVDLEKLAAHFGARCRAVCQIPFDPHLEEGAEIELDRLLPATRLALLDMAATVADDFPNDR
ncbi:MinD-like ATPase involved in chromosome partitioning or flagellar assembly [Kibdelosporangium banguiense]|uniref:MinD-like ATPase involved in chromosome partitioning or flagellar assembly n=1 Tax=Kibdelosporangium banguiense TaxID=1365924 RepID=A0ABS4TD48_9PSEU|nr:AAA family ATPase [Kibdelosporangium banguiense]MBP2322342.1 MinD-like ATPase involved in chromosome partitioning or flagellar assembly [Kibdelosporangium banguiense]